ncbi:MAG TPA: xanthine dehydrogenase family protein molybdopterin-binding subunit [Candidatus Limnocylindrales bacterium]|nr:xanthine dehydrogenase family protein molybdopterin-binding subunit [Candidatus Limnocylindrales bacterium]
MDYKWPAPDKRALIGTRISRLDGPWKSSGRVKYSFDINRPGMLYGRMVVCPYAHAKIVKIDTSEAEKMPGVKAVQIMFDEGKEALWAGQEIVALAAETEDQVRDAARKVRIQYQVLPHLVVDESPDKAGAQFSKDLTERTNGDPTAGFQQAEVTHEGHYGATVITHCCMESHGQVAEWNGDSLTVWASTQNVSGIGGEIGAGVGVPGNKVEIITPVMGGGFGSKFAGDAWGVACAQLAKKSGRPVKMMLERDHELMVAGARPSMYADVKVAAKKDGTLVAWDSHSWGTAGPSAPGAPPLPYVFKIPNSRVKHTAVLTNIGPERAWRAPNHPQMCVITMCALDDLAAKLNMDPLDFFQKNISLTGERAKTYTDEFAKASELFDWKNKWHPRGDSGSGPVKRGVGLSIHTWGGAANNSNCSATIHPDGSCEVSMGTQDLGVGTRTVVAIVAAESFGLPLDAVTVNIGDSKYPAAGASGGSTTVGGVSSATRRASVAAVNELFEKVAPSLGVTPDKLEAVGGHVRVIGDPSKSLSWKQACAKLGATPVTATGKTSRDLTSANVGGVQMAEVTVDTETGIVRVQKIVAVQDCGLVIDVKTAESQVYGALIMGVTYALYEEKLMDQQTGHCLNPNMEFYKLAGIGDVGELVVHMMTGPGYDDRGVIGLGEPPVVSPGAVISNAVANAIGVRVAPIPITPERVLAALAKGGRA